MAEVPASFVVGIPVYPGVDLMDVAAPREMFSWVPEVELHLVAASKDPVETRDGLRLIPDSIVSDEAVRTLDLIWVPGGDPKALAKLLAGGSDDPVIRYVTEVGGRAAYVTSVCEGAIPLASTGLLDGYEATTHWAFYPCMAAFPEVRMVPPKLENGELVYPRYHQHRNRITGGGISSGLDEALFLIQLIFGTEVATGVQTTTQYFPDPPIRGQLERATCCMIPEWPDNPAPC